MTDWDDEDESPRYGRRARLAAVILGAGLLVPTALSLLLVGGLALLGDGDVHVDVRPLLVGLALLAVLAGLYLAARRLLVGRPSRSAWDGDLLP